MERRNFIKNLFGSVASIFIAKEIVKKPAKEKMPEEKYDIIEKELSEGPSFQTDFSAGFQPNAVIVYPNKLKTVRSSDRFECDSNSFTIDLT